MNFNHQLIANPMHTWNANDAVGIRLVEAEHFQCVEANASHSYEDTCLYCMLLKVITPNTSTSTEKNSSGLQANKKFKKLHYAIMLLMADLMHPPKCFVMAFKSVLDLQRKLLGQDLNSTIGSCFYVLEPCPNVDVNQIGTALPVVDLRPSSELILLKKHNVLANAYQVANDNTMQVYFVLNNQHIMIETFSIDYQGGCKGTFCDRQNAIGCTCPKPNRTSHSLVTTCDVRVLDPDGSTMKLFCNFKSYQFTKLFFTDVDDLHNNKIVLKNNRHCQKTMRENMNNLVQVVNANHGWTIVGWHRDGEIKDPSSEEILVNPSSAPHLVLVMPSDSQDLLLQQFTDGLMNVQSMP